MSSVSLSAASLGEHARRGTRPADPRCGRIALAFPAARCAALAAAASSAIGALAIVVHGPGHVGYDPGWSLLWGRQIAQLSSPAFEAPGAPTPHPLANAVATVLAPLGDGAADALALISALCFGLLVWAGFRLGARLFGSPVGALFAVILFTSPALVNARAQSLVDIPFVALVMLAALFEAARPKRGRTVLVALTMAGLLRPEAWLLTGVYVLYMLPGGGRRRVLQLVGIAAIAPAIWAVFDLVVTGDALHSLHGTRLLAAELDRPRSLGAALQAAPVAMSDFLGVPLALVGISGWAAATLLLYRRALLPTAIIASGLAGFIALGFAGLPVLTRYLVMPTIMLALFAAVALLGWRGLTPGVPLRRAWVVVAALCTVAVIPTFTKTVRENRELVGFLAQRRAIASDLRALSTARAWTQAPDLPLHVTTRRAVPLLAAWRNVAVTSISPAQPPRGERVLLVRHTSQTVALNFYSLTTPAWSPLPDPTVRWHELYRNRSWVLLESQPHGAPMRVAGDTAGRDVVNIRP
jgi:hypothetical protein